MRSYVALASLSFLTFHTTMATAEDYMLRKTTTSNACHVQLKSAAKLGEDFKGPFTERKVACNEALAQYDSDLSDTGKCWTYGKGTVDACKKDSVNLP